MSDFSFVKIRKIEKTGDHKLRLYFDDGFAGEHDFAKLVAESGEMVLPLRDPAYFARAFLDLGTLTWPNGFDLATHVLHADMKTAGELRQMAAE